jgi:hypothetical protein
MSQVRYLFNKFAGISRHCLDPVFLSHETARQMIHFSLCQQIFNIPRQVMPYLKTQISHPMRPEELRWFWQRIVGDSAELMTFVGKADLVCSEQS